jgi:hypothetical protein
LTHRENYVRMRNPHISVRTKGHALYCGMGVAYDGSPPRFLAA